MHRPEVMKPHELFSCPFFGFFLKLLVHFIIEVDFLVTYFLKWMKIVEYV